MRLPREQLTMRRAIIAVAITSLLSGFGLPPRKGGLVPRLYAQLGDDTIAQIKGMTGLVSLNLGSSKVSDTDLARLDLPGMTRLRHLYLGRTRVTDAGLAHVKRVTGLRTLDLEYTRVTDAGLAGLEAMSDLRTLWLEGAGVGDAGLDRIKGLARLRTLSLAGTRVRGVSSSTAAGI
jgi:hypothetical protein